MKKKIPKWELLEGKDRSGWFTQHLHTTSFTVSANSSSKLSSSDTSSESSRASIAVQAWFCNASAQTSNSKTSDRSSGSSMDSLKGKTVHVTHSCEYATVTIEHSLKPLVEKLLTDPDWEVHRAFHRSEYNNLYYIDRVVVVQKFGFFCQESALCHAFKGSCSQTSGSSTSQRSGDIGGGIFSYGASCSAGSSSSSSHGNQAEKEESELHMSADGKTITTGALTMRYALLKRLAPRPYPKPTRAAKRDVAEASLDGPDM